MRVFIVAVPLFSADMVVEAYRLVCQSGTRLLGLMQDHTALSEAMHTPGIDTLNQIGIEPFTGGKPLFIDINQFQLIMCAPLECKIERELLRCVISRDVPLDQVSLDKIYELREAGIGITLEDIPYHEVSAPFYEAADYIIIDTTEQNFMTTYQKIRRQLRHCPIIFSNIVDTMMFRQLRSTRNAMFEGKFYDQPITRGATGVSVLRVNALQLLHLIGEEDFDLVAVSDIIRKDPSITVQLMRYINSPTIGIRRNITSINNAVAILGQIEVKKWIAVTVSSQLAEDKPDEIAKLALVRAKFAENLAGAFELGVFEASLFLTGLFSLLDIILGKPMHLAMREVAVSPRIHDALVKKTGEFYDVMDLIYSYEHADWQNVSLIVIRHNIDVEAINKAFLNALLWYRDLLDSVVEYEERFN